jgi:hypothetical protein
MYMQYKFNIIIDNHEYYIHCICHIDQSFDNTIFDEDLTAEKYFELQLMWARNYIYDVSIMPKNTIHLLKITYEVCPSKPDYAIIKKINPINGKL